MNSTQLTRISSHSIKTPYLDGEDGYFEAYKRHLEVSTQLAGAPNNPSGFEREAVQIMFIAVECYLKDIFCALRHQAFGTWDGLPKLMHTEFNKTFGARRFGHDLYALGVAITEICSNLANDADYQQFLTQLPKADKKNNIEADAWIQSRYDDPVDDLNIDFVSKLHQFEEVFNKVRTVAFRSFI